MIFPATRRLMCHKPAEKNTKSWRATAVRALTPPPQKESASRGMLAQLNRQAGVALGRIEDREPASRDPRRYAHAAETHVVVGRKQRVVNDVQIGRASCRERG